MTVCSTCDGTGKLCGETAYRAARTAGMDFKFASWTKLEDAKDEVQNADWLSDDDRRQVEDGEDCYIVTTFEECPTCIVDSGLCEQCDCDAKEDEECRCMCHEGQNLTECVPS